MAKLTITKPFTLTTPDGQKVKFADGQQEVPDELAGHWYVQAHVAPKPSLADLEAKAIEAAKVAEEAKAAMDAALEEETAPAVTEAPTGKKGK